jgi:hypothetical protein
MPRVLIFFFFLIAVLTALDLIIYVFCDRWYKGFQAEGSENIESQDDDETINKVWLISRKKLEFLYVFSSYLVKASVLPW